jgi:type VI secretion system protein ImpK
MLEMALEARHETTHVPVPSVALFQDFARELIALKWLVVQSSAKVADPDLASDSRGSHHGPTRAIAVWNRIISVLNRQSLEATRLGGPAGLEFHREAMYVMAALADETFLLLDWEGREFWLSHLIEAQVFRSHAAGDIFFRRIDALLRREDDAAAELAAVYLFAIGLGFRGRYGGEGFSAALESYRLRLFAFIARRTPALARHAGNLFPETYKNTIHTGIDRPIPSARKWRIALVAVFLAWLLIAQVLWWNLSHDLNSQLARLSSLMDVTVGASPSGAKK